MTIAHTVQQTLERNEIPFDLLTHPHTPSSLRTADRAHIRPAALAKAVLLADDYVRSRYLMAVVPATHRVSMSGVARCAGRPMHLASEDDAAWLFADCEPGAIPPLGPAYGVETLWDDSLMDQPELYFEAGDHEHLVHVKAKDFARLLPNCAHGQIGRPRP